MFFASTVLLPAGIGVVLGIVSLFVAHYHEKEWVEAALFLVSGFLVAVSVVIDPSMAGWLHEFRSWNLIGVNVLLAVMIWSAMYTWYEVVRPATAQRSWHYIKSPVAAWLFGLTLPLWSLHGLKVWGVGIILAVATWIVSRHTGTMGRKITPVLAGLAAVGIGVVVITWVAPYRQAVVLGVGVVVAIAAISGTLVLITVVRNKDDSYHHYRGPVYVFIFALALVVAFGAPAAHMITSGQNHAVATDAKIAGPGDYGNPIDPLARLVATQLEAHAKDTRTSQ
jgi:hypothetical protein